MYTLPSMLCIIPMFTLIPTPTQARIQCFWKLGLDNGEIVKMDYNNV